MPRLLLVRHGQSEWNVERRWQGQRESPLTELGRRQAREAAGAIGAVDAVVTSDLGRAAETATIIGETLGVGPVIADERLRERHAGPWEGLTRDEIEAGWPGALAAGDRPDGWERDDDLAERAFAALGHWATQGEHVLVVTHGGLIGTVERRLGADWERTANLGGRFVDHDGERFTLGERIALLEPSHVTVPDQI